VTASAPARPAVPASTYRLQLRPGEGLAAAAELVDYLDELGAGAAYLSPIFAARSGSQHGYDVTDMARVNPQLGTRAELDRLAEDLRGRGMGLVLDIVPNHAAASPENPRWRDLLKHGPTSPAARWFDVDWDPVGDPELSGRVLLPLLGKPYGEALADRELVVAAGDDGPVVRYYDLELPLDPATVDGPLPADADALHELLERQHYRLADWRTAPERVNYRRFFDIGDLVSVRVEDPAVFAEGHALVAELVRAGSVTGLRVDHVDGLLDPAGYLARLSSLPAPRRPWIVAEKILLGDESLPPDWQVDGTTGYETARALTLLTLDEDGLPALRDVYRRLGGQAAAFGELARRLRRSAADRLFSGQVDALAGSLARIAAADLAARDVPAGALRTAIVEMSAALPAYRTYVVDAPPSEHDRRPLETALAAAAPRCHPAALAFLQRVLTLDGDVAERTLWLPFVRRWQRLTGPMTAKGLEDTALYRDAATPSLNEVGGDPEPPATALGAEAFHAFCGALRRDMPLTMTAGSTHDTKRSEDVRARLNVLSELPAEWALHAARWRRLVAPLRGAVGGRVVPDADAELFLLATLVGAWPLYAHEREGFAERLDAYLLKASREAKRLTSWLEPDEAYERELREFTHRILDPDAAGELLASVSRFVARVAPAGAVNSLAQLVLRLAGPGVPDVYRGSELWDLSLADPDNRRPVDFELRRRLLAEVGDADPATLVRDWRDGRIKLRVTAAALRARRERPRLFIDGDHLPLPVAGPRARHAVAFARHGEDGWAIALAPRLVLRMLEPGVPAVRAAAWGETAVPLPPGAPARWRDAVSGRDVRAPDGWLRPAEVLRPLPVALLVA
jgi:malto-oligosyltrehalose synthase